MWLTTKALLAQRERKARANASNYSALRTTPHNLNTSLVLPANAKIYASIAASSGSPVLLCTVNGRNVYIPAVAAGEIVPLGYFEKGATVTAVYNASTINLYLGGELGYRPVIATKTV